MAEENIVVMDGPGPFYFGRLESPLRLLGTERADAVAIEGQMEVDETGRKVVVRIPLSRDDAVRLRALLSGLKAK
jgi:hypothetical protein